MIVSYYLPSCNSFMGRFLEGLSRFLLSPPDAGARDDEVHVLVERPLAGAMGAFIFVRLFMDVIFFSTLFLLTVIGTLVVYTLMIGDIESKTYEFGMLRALGLEFGVLRSLLTIQAFW